MKRRDVERVRAVRIRRDGGEHVFTTKVPRPLRQAVKLYCIQSRVQMTRFIRAALQEKLAAER